jgi:autotransporter-associated beta strand protein
MFSALRRASIGPAALIGCCILVTPASAQSSWTGATGDWFNPANWSLGVPNSATVLPTVGNGGTAQIAGAVNLGNNAIFVTNNSTVELQSGGSIAAGSVIVDAGGELLFNGSTAVNATIALGAGAVLHSSLTGNLTSRLVFGDGTTSRIEAAPGQELTINLGTLGTFPPPVAGTGVIFGSATNNGVIIVGPQAVGGSYSYGNPTFTIEVAGGTLRVGDPQVLPLVLAGHVTTVDAGAALDLNTFSGALAVTLIDLKGGTFRTGADVTLGGNFVAEAGSTIAAASGSTLTITADNFLLRGAVKFGSATDTGVIVIGTRLLFPQASIEVVSGTLRAGSSMWGVAIAQLDFTKVDVGATLDLNDFNVTLNKLQGGGSVTTGVSAAMTVSLTGSSIFSGAINGAGQLELLDGVNILTGANTYTGGTRIDVGATLQLGSGGATGSVNGDITDNGSLVINRSNVYEYGGIISGNGSLTQSGPGTLVLTGNNLYTGGTAIASGAALQLGNGGASGSVVGDITDNGTLIFNRSGSLNVAGTISGAGAVQQNGSGTTTLSAVNTYTGGTTVNAGTLNVTGSIAGTVDVVGGVLAGTGPVSNLIVGSGGTFIPGAGIPGSSMSVTGSLMLASAALYVVQVNPVTSSLVSVAGATTLAGATVGVNFLGGSYVSKQYRILRSSGGVSGTFGSLVEANLPSAFLTSLSYDTNDVFLNLQINYGVLPGLNQNQRAAGTAIGNFFNRNGIVPTAFASLTPNGLTQASGEPATGTQQATFNAMQLFLGLMTDPLSGRRLGDGYSPASAPSFAEQRGDKAHPGPTGDPAAVVSRYAPGAAPDFDQRWNVWTAGFGGSQTTNGNAVVGSNVATSQVYGTAIGVDYRLSPFTQAGFALAGGGTSFSVAHGLGGGRSDLFQAGAYLRHFAGPAYISAAVAYGWQDVTTDRSVAIVDVERLRARFNANAFSGRLESGYRLAVPWIAVTPYAAGQFTTLDLPAYAEQTLSGANTFALAYSARNIMASRTELGVRPDRSWAMTDSVLTLRGRAAWAHDFNTIREIGATFQTLPGASFFVNGAAQAHDAVLAATSAEMNWVNGWSTAIAFEGEFSNLTASYAGKGVVRYSW